MNFGRRSIALQTRINALRAERKRIDTELARLRSDLAAMTPRRPRTGATMAIIDVLRSAAVPMTSRDVADRLPQFDIQRVQVLLYQAVRRGLATRVPSGRRRKGPYAPKWLFSVQSACKEAA